MNADALEPGEKPDGTILGYAVARCLCGNVMYEEDVEIARKAAAERWGKKAK